MLKLVGEHDTVSNRDLGDAAHYVKFAFGAYGYMLYLWSKPQHRFDPPKFLFARRNSRTPCLLLSNILHVFTRPLDEVKEQQYDL